jgi:integrase/recombinase XerD
VKQHALISLLAINGPRISEALGADIDKLGLERGHRTVTVVRKGGKVVTIPLAPGPPGRSTWPAGARLDGPISVGPMAGGWIGTVPVGSCVGWPAARA